MRQRRAFTILELLVVIVIIGVLAAVLLPALVRSKESGRRVACSSNHRQLGLAGSLYAADHEGMFPPRRLVASWPTQLLPDYQSLDLLLCPSERLSSGAVNPSDADLAPRSYVMNSFADHFAATLSASDWKSFGKGTYPGAFNESAIAHPSDTILFGEKKSGRSEMYVDLGSVVVTVLDWTEQRRHSRQGGQPKSGGSNHAYLDGSVRYSGFGRSLCPINQWAVTEAGRTNYAICIY